ncbi:MAG: YbaK/EbsC family protein [Chloroflexi bacterium]|nr:YbaK/EbsC family protein [Chloroflexota bacterium]
MDCKARLEQYLSDNKVTFTTLTHPTAYTAQQVAETQRVRGEQVAKVVMVLADSMIVMLVLPACHRIAFGQLDEVLGVKGARLAKEEEFAGIFPDCEIGTMPPFGNLYGVPVYVDRALSQASEIVIPAGTHRHTIKIVYREYARLAQPVVDDFTVHL